MQEESNHELWVSAVLANRSEDAPAIIANRLAQFEQQSSLPVRSPAAIDTELIATVRTYNAASKAGVHELTLMPIVARVAALVWVLHPELNEVSAQGYAWELITSVKDEEGQ